MHVFASIVSSISLHDQLLPRLHSIQMYAVFNALELIKMYLFLLDCMYRARLFDLAVSLLPGLDGQEIGVLFSAVKPALQVCQFGYIIQ